MNNIVGFLQKFLTLDNNNTLKLVEILNTIKNNTGVLLKKEDLDLKDNILKIKTSPVVRNEIFMHKENIEISLKEKNIFLNIV